jgi:glycerophosphoryl diester phosphodiesterase
MGRWTLLPIALLAACASPSMAPDASADVGRDAPLDAARLFVPSELDCTATSIPSRASPLPLTCATDTTCTGMRIASSHRGAGAPGGLTPENTLAGIRAAIALGADEVEMDVQPTSDGALVLMHDDTVDRTTMGTGTVADMTLAQIQALAIRTTGFDGDYTCEHVPTFAQALALAEGRIVIVVDGSKTDRVDLVVDAIHAANALERVVYDVEDTARLNAALALEPQLRFLIRATTEAELTTRLAAVAPRTPVYVHIDMASPAIMAPLVHAAGYRVFALGFITDLAAVRDSHAYEALYTSGVDMVQSNRIDLLGSFLGR